MHDSNLRNPYLSRPAWLVVVAVILTWFLLPHANAQRLALRSYRTADGLPNDNIKRIFQDAKGYLWIATWEGLSRFDGYEFKNYTIADGLGHMLINDVTADNHGRLWVATNGGGVSVLSDDILETQPADRRAFKSFPIGEHGESNSANFVNRILFDKENRLWCVTDKGLYRASSLNVSDFAFELMMPGVQPAHANAALRDDRGRLWFSVSGDPDLVVRVENGRLTNYEVRLVGAPDAPAEIHSIVQDRSGRILAADLNNVFEAIQPEASEIVEWKRIPGEGHPLILSISVSNDDGFWLGTSGLVRVKNARKSLFTTANGLSINNVQTFLSDREGNLWVGTNGGGLNKLSSEAIVSFTVDHGLPRPAANWIIEDNAGRIFAQTGCIVTEITTDDKLVPLPGADRISHKDCPFVQLLLQDKKGMWWFSTARGLEFFSGSELQTDRGTLLVDANGSAVQFTQIHEDAEGTIWLTNDRTGILYRVEPSDVPRAELISENVPAEYLIRDKASGALWIANRARLWRIRNGEVSEIERIEGLPILQPRGLFQDSKGRVWIGTRHHGALVTDEPGADELRFRRYTSVDGLGSETVWEIAEDDGGRIFFGTGRGIDQLDTESGRIHHFTIDEGVANTSVVHLFQDSRGLIWAATDNGVTRIDPGRTRVNATAPPIFINQVRIAGEALPIAETGLTEVPQVDLASSQNNIAIRFGGVSLRGEGALRYEYRLEGVDTNWVPAGQQREVVYANLGSGNYSFSVRALNTENVSSEQPATFAFQIVPPIYLRWWFIALASLIGGIVIYGIYRERVARLVAIERTRTRIATDLHDDIGSDLSKISLLSDIVRVQLSNEPAERDRMLTRIADISRTSVDSMRDIVWAIDPKRDSVVEMTRRMLKHAEEVFVDKGVRVSFKSPRDHSDQKLSMDIRREVFLIFKEAVNNAARHSGCTEVEIDFRVSNSEIYLKVADNGRSFDPAGSFIGNGLSNMRDRASKMGGSLEVATGKGTVIELRTPARN